MLPLGLSGVPGRWIVPLAAFMCRSTFVCTGFGDRSVTAACRISDAHRHCLAARLDVGAEIMLRRTRQSPPCAVHRTGDRRRRCRRRTRCSRQHLEARVGRQGGEVQLGDVHARGKSVEAVLAFLVGDHVRAILQVDARARDSRLACILHAVAVAIGKRLAVR